MFKASCYDVTGNPKDGSAIVHLWIIRPEGASNPFRVVTQRKNITEAIETAKKSYPYHLAIEGVEYEGNGYAYTLR